MRKSVEISVALALVTAVGACGSSGSSKGLSKAEFVKQAEAICVAADAQSSKVSDSLEGPNESFAQFESAYTDQLLPILRKEISDLRALKPPAADQAKIKQMLDDLSTGVDEAQTEVKAAKTATQLGTITEPAGMKAASTRAKAYGLPTCGSGG